MPMISIKNKIRGIMMSGTFMKIIFRIILSALSIHSRITGNCRGFGRLRRAVLLNEVVLENTRK